MAVDVSTIALAIDSTGVVKAKGDLDAMVPSAAKVEQVGNDVSKAFDRMGVSIASMSSSSTRARSDMSDAAAKYIAALEKEIATFGATRAEIERLETASLGFSKTERDKAAALGAAIDAMHRQEDAAKALAAQQDRNAVASAAFIARLQEQTAVQGLSKAELLAYQAAQLGITKEAAPLIAGLGEAGKEMEHFGFRTARSKTELLVLAHELSQGNYKRFGGSLMVLGEQTGIMSLAFSAAGLSIAAVGVAIAAVGVAAYKGYEQLETFNKSVLLTGNYAGITAGAFDSMAKSIASSARTTLGAAQDALQGVVSSGRFGPDLLRPVSEAVTRMADLTGEKASKIIADFDRMANGVAKYAEEHNKSMHLITAAQYEQIKALEDAGKAEEAQGVYLGLLNTRLAEHEKSIGTIASAWRTAKSWVSEYIQSLENIGKGSAVSRQIELSKERLADLEKSQASPFRFRDYTPDMNDEKLKLNALQSSQEFADGYAKIQAASDKRQQAGIEGSMVVKHLTEEIDKRDKATRKIEEYTVAVKKMRDAGDPLAPSPQKEADTIAALRTKGEPRIKVDHSAQKLETAFDSRLQSLTADGIKLDAQTKNYELYGKAIDNTRLAILNLDIATGKLQGLTPEKIRQLQAVAGADDAKAMALKQVEAAAAADKRTQSIEKATNALAMNSREVKIANELAAIEASGLVKGTTLYEDAAAKRVKALNAEADAQLKRKLAGEQMNVDSEVHKIDQQTAALGMTKLALVNAADAARLYALAQADIAANPGQTAQILDAMITKTNQLSAARQRASEASRSFDIGAKTSLEKYRDSATNTAAFTEKFIDGSFSKMEDAIVNFTKTGKLNLGGLFQFMADEFIRQQARIMIAQATSGGANGGGLAGIIGSLASAYFAGNSGAATGVANALPGNSLDNLIGVTGGYGTIPGKASGGPVSAGGMYLVGEKGPELLRMGNQSGHITPNDKMGGSGGSTAVTLNVINNGPPVKATQSQRETSQGSVIDLVIEAVAHDVNSGGKTHDAIQRRFGLNPGGSTPRY